ncbi:potassium channel family protein [Agromyces ramosus]|uniref:Voltage-gated potassium channel n=1 Tax=Agromyces ramosus TaxID=33879 RepID=A0ABU0RBQ7_9MICO|nr:potassium channel family protein [Agromyces ramosus]MDQ0895493.1 voltage-gated potassium channel [Agromyces ramosus]
MSVEDIRYDEVAAPRRARWEAGTTVPLVVLGIAFIVAYSVMVLVPDLPGGTTGGIWTVLVATWVAFLIDIVVRIVLTPRGLRWDFVRHNMIDVLSVIVPLFRAFRVLRLLGEVPYLQRRSGEAVRTRIVIYAASYAVLFVYFIALATLDAERDAPDATITTFGDSVWWAIVTIATVGYGDTYPVTPAGRAYAVMLMVGGVAIIGTASATIISLINERIGRGQRGQGGAEPPSDGTV